MPPSSLNISLDLLMDVSYAIKSLAQGQDLIHEDIRRCFAENSREHERVAEILRGLSTELLALPALIGDRVEKENARFIDKYVNDLKSMTDEMRSKLWILQGELGTTRTPPSGIQAISEDTSLTFTLGKAFWKKAIWYFVAGGGGMLLLEFVRFLVAR
jgi:hypothetical protein